MAVAGLKPLPEGAGLLVLNSGSASFKWSLFGPAGAQVETGSSEDLEQDLGRLLAQLPRPRAVGHRIVHGGHRYTQAVRLDARICAELGSLVPFAPLHQPAALRAIERVWAHWPDIEQVGCFDTAFHSTLPDAAARYALPREWSERFGLRRFGAHGLSVEWSVRRLAQWLGAPPPRLLVCHLGGGSSFTAVQDGRSIDTTMGLTPLEGPAMATRSGSVDPGLLLYLLGEGGLTVAELADGLQKRSGLLGMSGASADLRRVRAAAQSGDAVAASAIDHLLWTYRRAAGALCGVMGGVDAVVFTGGIGEHQAFVRDAIGSALGGCVIDPEVNASAQGDGRISAEGSKVAAFVIQAREDQVIRDHMIRVLTA